ncbi:MAG: type III-B CRISPR module RAMP protein Cmr6, partial [Ktedonobacteraceae bacterium]|nr:type III-B CRISPR module RAMP protein Cmr6 [Ktedonobacteraceae bacterium]
MGDRYNLPADTATLVNDHITRCKNLALILDKYPPQTVVADTKHKGPWLQNLAKGDHIDPNLAQSAYNRWHAMVSAMQATLFQASLDWRMVIGLGGESVIETDITLHHLYGIPFIPASALKGLTRAYVTGEIEGYRSEKIEDDNDEIKRIFGSQKQAGTVIFFDAMPTDGKAAFTLDIMNPHYAEYYGGNKPPTNDQNPIPVTFLTVTDTTFTFALAPRDASKTQHIEDVEQRARVWLQEALQKYGVGGKTSAGYGYFKKERAATESIQVLNTADTVPQTPSKRTEQIRARLPQFRKGQEIRGAVVPLTEELRRKMPPGIKAVLRYESFLTTEAVMAVSEEEAQNWKT